MLQTDRAGKTKKMYHRSYLIAVIIFWMFDGTVHIIHKIHKMCLVPLPFCQQIKIITSITIISPWHHLYVTIYNVTLILFVELAEDICMFVWYWYCSLYTSGSYKSVASWQWLCTSCYNIWCCCCWLYTRYTQLCSWCCCYNYHY